MKSAFITGAGRGLGRDIARALAMQGYGLSLFSRSESSLRETERLIKNESPDAKLLIQVGDIRETGKVQNAVRESVSLFGRIDVLLNNAAIYVPGSVELSEQKFFEQISVNLNGAYNVLHAVVPQMKKQRSGYIFNVASRAGKVGFGRVGAYCASKFGLVGLSESLYRELAPEGIKVTALCPSWIDTEMAQEGSTPLSNSDMIQTRDIAKTIEWLLSLSASCAVKEITIECRRDLT